VTLGVEGVVSILNVATPSDGLEWLDRVAQHRDETAARRWRALAHRGLSPD
jgi:hypothetical protein